ncbi:hypothetical protein V1460_01575 [Streptomyces sp. SCSIO 30461]|uniref:hypothetical protein n=1 Tax=Streptomyces sp. SCSIO 30461 TaxID=3118085 RepID=UPI0030D24DAB
MRRRRQGRRQGRPVGYRLAGLTLCLGGALAACGGGGQGGGYAAVGAAGADSGPHGAVRPSGSVALVPLDGAPTPGAGGESDTAAEAQTPGPSASRGALTEPGGPVRSGTAADAPPGRPGRPASPSGAPTITPAPTDTGDSEPGGSPSDPGGSDPAPAPSPGPAVLSVGAPERDGTDRRWCEKVTLTFRNSGDSPAGSGTITLGTHIIGGLGIDWATIRSSHPVPAPIAAKATRTQTYTVCVDSWRVPLGMHIETRDVRLDG